MRWLQAVTLILLLCAISACSLFRAQPLENKGFLPWPDVVVEHRERAPFNGYWVFDPIEYDAIRQEYKKVYIAPVDIGIVQKMYEEDESDEDTRIARIEEAEQLAHYFRNKLILLLKESDIQPVEEPGPKTLSLQLALVQVVPTSPGINLLGTVAGVFVPGGGIIKAAGEGSVAMEGYVTEQNRFPILYEQFKDREGQKYRPFSVKDYQRYAHIRQILDEWSMQLSALLTTTHDVPVEDSDLVSVNPL